MNSLSVFNTKTFQDRDQISESDSLNTEWFKRCKFHLSLFKNHGTNMCTTHESSR